MVDKIVKNWHIITLTFGLIVSLILHFDPKHTHEVEFAEEAFDAVATVVAQIEEDGE